MSGLVYGKHILQRTLYLLFVTGRCAELLVCDEALTFPFKGNTYCDVLIVANGVNDRTRFNLQFTNAGSVIRRLRVTVEDLCGRLHLVFEVNAYLGVFRNLYAFEHVSERVAVGDGALPVRAQSRRARCGT